jgi:hypothetical protein
MGGASSFVPPAVYVLDYLVTEKLACNNIPLWKAQVLSVIKGAQVGPFLDSSTQLPPKTVPASKEKPDELVPNPEYEAWVAKDQQILNYLLSSLTRDILTQVATHSTAAALWEAIEAMFSSQSRSRIINTRMALAAANKGTSSVAEYYGKMKTLADEMAFAGKKLEDEELVTYILAGLDIEFNLVVSAVAARVNQSPSASCIQSSALPCCRMDRAHQPTWRPVAVAVVVATTMDVEVADVGAAMEAAMVHMENALPASCVARRGTSCCGATRDSTPPSPVPSRTSRHLLQQPLMASTRIGTHILEQPIISPANFTSSR